MLPSSTTSLSALICAAKQRASRSSGTRYRGSPASTCAAEIWQSSSCPVVRSGGTSPPRGNYKHACNSVRRSRKRFRVREFAAEIKPADERESFTQCQAICLQALRQFERSAFAQQHLGPRRKLQRRLKQKGSSHFRAYGVRRSCLP
jgi:hypothetical protein